MKKNIFVKVVTLLLSCGLIGNFCGYDSAKATEEEDNKEKVEEKINNEEKVEEEANNEEKVEEEINKEKVEEKINNEEDAKEEINKEEKVEEEINNNAEEQADEEQAKEANQMSDDDSISEIPLVEEKTESKNVNEQLKKKAKSKNVGKQSKKKTESKNVKEQLKKKAKSKNKTPEELEAILTDMERTTISKKEIPGFGSGKSDNAYTGLNARFEHGHPQIFKKLSLDTETLVTTIKTTSLPFLEKDTKKILNEYLTLFFNIFKYATHHQGVKINDTYKKINDYDTKYTPTIALEKIKSVLTPSSETSFEKAIQQYTTNIQKGLKGLQESAISMKTLLDTAIEKVEDDIGREVTQLAKTSLDQNNNITKLQQVLIDRKSSQVKNKEALEKISQKTKELQKSIQSSRSEVVALIEHLETIGPKIEAVLYMANKQMARKDEARYSHTDKEGHEVADNVTAALRKYQELIKALSSSLGTIFEVYYKK
ncbi:MAG: hypothetical protein LBT70_01195 [Holosporaceae bacterium]|jgi:hypothetical protein|nr:hypothetical protein [Holosporaceae bacterium]